MYQNPPLYAPGPPVVYRPEPRRRRALIVMLLLPFLLSAAPAPDASPEATAQEAALPPGADRVTLRDLPFAGLGQELVRVTADGRRIPAGGTAFAGASLVVSGGVAVGADSGHVLVQHQRAINDTGIALSLVLPDNGQVTDTLTVEHAVIRAVIGAISTTTAVATGPDLALVHSDGRFARVDIGATNFFGSTS
jgi:hypothetical protein